MVNFSNTQKGQNMIGQVKKAKLNEAVRDGKIILAAKEHHEYPYMTVVYRDLDNKPKWHHGWYLLCHIPHEIFDKAFRLIKTKSITGQVITTVHMIHEKIPNTTTRVEEIAMTGDLYCVEIYDNIINNGIHSIVLLSNPLLIILLSLIHI